MSKSKNGIGPDDIVFQSCNFDEHYKQKKYQSSKSCNRSCYFSDAFHLLFLALMARLSSVGLISKIPVLNVTFNQLEVIVFVKQSDNIADVSVQRRSSPFDPSTSSQSSRLSQMSCFRADMSVAKRLLSTRLVLGEMKMCKETFAVCKPDISHCCRSRLPLTNIDLPSHFDDGSSSSQSMFNGIGQCVSFRHQCTATNSADSRRTPTQRVNEHLLSVQRATKCQSCDTNLL